MGMTQRKVNLTPNDAEKVVSESSTRRKTRAGLLSNLKEENLELPEIGETVSRRRSERLAKLAVENPEIPMTEDDNDDDGDGDFLSKCKDEELSASEEWGNKRKRRNQPVRCSRLIGTDIEGSKEAESLLVNQEMDHTWLDTENGEQQQHSSGRTTTQSIGEKFTALMEVFPDSTMQETSGMNSGMEVDMEIESESEHHELVDESLPRQIRGINSPSTSIVHASGKGMSGWEIYAPSKEKSLSNSVDLTLRVKKTLSLWERFESMEIFQRMPQRPHFQPLEHLNESERELEALRHMMNFLAVVEKVSMLQFGDDSSTTNTILEKLAELEAHGFNVVSVRDRVIQLLALKQKHKNVRDVVNEFNSRIQLEEAENESVKDISEMKERIRKLKEELIFAQTALHCAETAKKKREDKIEGLVADRDEREKGLKVVFQEFLSAATSPLP